MKRAIISAVALGTVVALQPGATWASDDENQKKIMSRVTGITLQVENDIRALLTAQGYEVRKIKVDDGLYEAYALKDKQRFEIYLDNDLKIVKVKTDD